MKAVVMAGGFGTRIAPLTNSLPKPMLPILNIPMMEHIILQLKDIGITEFVVLLYFKPEIIKNHFGDGSSRGIKIDYVLPDDDYGTAGAVKKAEKYLQNEQFIIVSGDLVTNFDFKKIVDFHNQKGSKLTITLTSVPDPLQFGVVIADSEGKIVRFLEKPGWGEVFSDTINTGIYILESEILSYIPENTNYDFSKDLFPKLMSEKITLWGCSAKGYWRDVGNPQSYREVMEDLLTNKVDLFKSFTKTEFSNGTVYAQGKVDLPKDLVINGSVVIGNNVKIGSGVTLKNVVLGNNTTVGNNAAIEYATIWHDSKVGELADLKNSVICNGCSIDKKSVISQGAIIAEECEIGKSVHIEKDVIIWPKKTIEDGAIVSSNIIWGDKYKKALFEGGQVKGRTNIELSCEMATKLASAFASTLPVGAQIYVSRDYHKASRMLKRAFLSGLMSAGVHIINPHFIPSAILRHSLSKHPEVLAGVHFRQSETNAHESEILFYDESGLPINSNVEKNCERIFFRENFRRVSNDELGAIYESDSLTGDYLASVVTSIDLEVLRSAKPKVVVDLLYGNTSMIYPTILNNLGVENVILDAYFDDRKLSKLHTHVENAKENISQIIRSLKMGAGFMIYPHGRQLEIFTDEGKMLTGDQSLLLMLRLLDLTASKDRKTTVYLPVWAPDIIDSELTNLEITRGKMHNLQASELRKYDFVGTTDKEFAFTAFGTSFDAMFASVKLIELLAKSEESLSNLVAKNGRYSFIHQQIGCDISLKGTMMRKFSEDAMGKEVSFLDGVKIIENGSFVVMVPDQYGDMVHLFIQAKDEESGAKLLTNYATKITKWKSEE